MRRHSGYLLPCFYFTAVMGGTAMARGCKAPLSIVLSPAGRNLDRWQRSTTIAAGLARRGKIILLLADGHSQSRVALAVASGGLVRKWAKRFLAQRLDGLVDNPGRGARQCFPPEVAMHVVRMACERPDKLGRCLSQWDGAELARQLMARAGRAHLRRDRTADSGVPSAQALAPPCLAVSQALTGLRLLCDRLGTHRSRHASTA